MLYNNKENKENIFLDMIASLCAFVLILEKDSS